VLPFVPLENVSMEECVALAHRVGQELWDRYRIPVYFYEAAATRPERVRLENVRRGQYEGLREDAVGKPERLPDIGEPRLHSTAGAIAVAARKLLIAYNIYLNTRDVSLAKEIARAIRSSSGGLPNVKAIGVEMKSRGLAQVSINLTDFEVTPLHVVYAAVQREAERRGCAIVSGELVGLIPRKAVEQLPESFLLIENFSPAQVIENRLAAVAGILPPQPVQTLQPLVDTLLEAVEKFSGRALDATQESLHGSGAARNRGEGGGAEQNAAETQLEVAAAAAEIYERLVQLEALSATSMQMDWNVVKQAAMDAARGALQSVDALLPSLQDAGTAERIKSAAAEIEAKLTEKPVTTGN
jgi:glutamate formiminotransferase